MKLSPRWTAVAALTAVFLVGVIGGVALEEVVEEIEWPLVGEDDDGDELEDEEELLGGLGLDTGQVRRIAEMLDTREDRIEDYWDSRLPEVRALLDSSRAEIRSVLTPRQRAEFDRRVARLQDRAPEDGRD